ncbi:MAG: hypothetical protein ACOC95_09730, partial [Planctomycetota bacterium]
MYRNAFAVVRRLPVRHRRPLIATGLLLVGVALASLVACCGYGGGPAPAVRPPSVPPPPRSPDIIRVRLLDPTETATLATT